MGKFTDSEETAIKIYAQTIFAKKNDGDTYSQVFMLLGNGMTKDNWIQTNNYSGDTGYLATPYAEYWEQFVNGGSGVRGVIYNDILLASYYDLTGRQITEPAGICISRTVYSDGTVKVEKIKTRD